MTRRARFAWTLLAFAAIAMVVDALLLPPDPYTQLLFLAPTTGFGFVLAYWLVYRGGFERLDR
ncbi:hypothetical protein ACFQJD_18030 [Haloplanus sp. GCM10025708]|uniref:DUF7534 family protein n=1 Tax=Haloferacaceae TaxID=1644056 RepID=UPI00360BF211